MTKYSHQPSQYFRIITELKKIKNVLLRQRGKG